MLNLDDSVAACGIARTYYLYALNHTYDTSWTGFNLFVWSLLECHLAIIFACAPALKAFVGKFMGAKVRYWYRSRSARPWESLRSECTGNVEMGGVRVAGKGPTRGEGVHEGVQISWEECLKRDGGP